MNRVLLIGILSVVVLWGCAGKKTVPQEPYFSVPNLPTDETQFFSEKEVSQPATERITKNLSNESEEKEEISTSYEVSATVEETTSSYESEVTSEEVKQEETTKGNLLSQTEAVTEAKTKLQTEVTTKVTTYPQAEATTQAVTEKARKYLEFQGKKILLGDSKELEFASKIEGGERILTSYEEIIEAVNDGFNSARAEMGYAPISFDKELSKDCEHWADVMASSGKGTSFHGDIFYISKYFSDEYRQGREGVGQMGLMHYVPVIDITGEGYVLGESVQYEYENYVRYDTAFAEGKALCYHVGAQKYDIGKVGCGIACGVDEDGVMDYYTCLAITYCSN